jgi:hypothetical protein
MPRLAPVVVSISLLACVASGAAALQAGPERLRVFLDCESCDFDYVRTEMGWVDYVRDRTDADIHILVTTQPTGSGGREYTVNLIGLRSFAPRVDTVRYVSNRDDTRDITRRGLTRALQFAIVPWLQGSPTLAQLSIRYSEQGESESGLPASGDPWNLWVFSISGEANGDGESLQSGGRYSLDLNANRTTEAWKLEFGASANYRENRFEVDSGTIVKSIRKTFDADIFAGRSISPHFTLGFGGVIRSSTFGNVDRAWRIAPAVEYNIFPYSEYTRRALTLQYSAGVNSFRYNEITIFGRIAETRASHAVSLAYNTRQPWGNMGISIGASQFLHDGRKYRASISGEGDVRLWKGLSVNFDGRYGRVRDQLSIPKRDATSDEVLLQIRELRTNYSYDFGIGLRYRFGSIFNNVVNSRFRHGIAGTDQF